MKIHKHLEHTRHAMPYWLVAMLDALQPTQPLVRLGPFHLRLSDAGGPTMSWACASPFNAARITLPLSG